MCGGVISKTPLTLWEHMPTTDELIKAFREKIKSAEEDSGQAKKFLNKEIIPYAWKEMGFDVVCPKCGSLKYVNDGEGRFKCKECGKKYRPTSGSIFSGYKFSKAEWKNIIDLTLKRDSLVGWTGTLETYVGKMSAWELRLKIMSALMNVQWPKLSGIVQVDGTYFRESQKRHKAPISFVFENKTREPREEYQPSLCGIFGKEFICCIAGTDNKGYAFAECVSLGSPKYDDLKKCLEKHAENISFLVTDNHYLYEEYCDEKSIPHHITPSTYRKEKFIYGYVEKSDKYHPNPLTEEEIANNEKVTKRMFEERSGPHIRNSGSMKYENYLEIINNQGASYFDMDEHINKFHGVLKEACRNTSKNVSSNYLQAYISLQVYKHNFRTKYGHEYGSGKDDKEIVFKDVVENYDYETFKTLRNTKVVPYKFNEKANIKARDNIIKARAFLGVKEGVFDGNEQEIEMPDIFNKRKCFRQMKPHRINYLCKINGIASAGLNKTKKADELAKLPNADKIILKEIYLLYYASEEEIMKAIEEGFIENKYMKKALAKQRAIGLDIDNISRYENLKKIVFDIETTGLNKNGDDEILSLSIIDEEGNVLLNQLFKPEHHTSWPRATEVNGIKYSDVKDKPTFKETLPVIQNIFNEAQMLIGYNSINFDLPLLKQKGLIVGNVEHFDVMAAFKAYRKQKSNPKLTTCANYFKFKWEEKAHTSLGDVKATLYCYKQMIKWKATR